MRDGKKPRVAYSPPTPAKVPRMAEDPVAFHKERPVWRMGRVDVGCVDWGWNLIEGGALHRIRERLGAYETMTFREILNKDATGCHDVETFRMASAAKKLTDKIGVDSLFSLRITGEERVWGIRTGHVIELLWWDPGHAVCPSPKKNT